MASHRSQVALAARRGVRRVLTNSRWTRDASAFLSFLESAAGYERAYFNLSVDLELAWGIARRGSGMTSEAERLELARRARANLPVLLDLCDRHRVPLTVATVGRLALAACTHGTPPSFAPSWVGGSWYDVHRGETLSARPGYFGADLVHDLLERPAGHELASHTFTHVDLADEETPAEVAWFELRESFDALGELYPGLTTLVFPKNHPSYLELVREAGFSIYRGASNVMLDRDEYGLWRFPLGLWLSPRALSSGQTIEITTAAIRRRQLVNFYFHLHEFPSPEGVKRHLGSLFSFIDAAREQGTLVIDSMRGVVEALQPAFAGRHG